MENQHIELEIKRLHNLLYRYIDGKMSRLMPPDINFSNTWIIMHIASHKDTDVFQRDLEKEFDVTRSTVSKVIDLLVKKGYIVRESVAYDARLKKLVLTPKAQELAELMHDDAYSTEEILTAGFSDEEILRLREYISRMYRNILSAASKEECLPQICGDGCLSEGSQD